MTTHNLSTAHERCPLYTVKVKRLLLLVHVKARSALVRRRTVCLSSVVRPMRESTVEDQLLTQWQYSCFIGHLQIVGPINTGHPVHSHIRF